MALSEGLLCIATQHDHTIQLADLQCLSFMFIHSELFAIILEAIFALSSGNKVLRNLPVALVFFSRITLSFSEHLHLQFAPASLLFPLGRVHPVIIESWIAHRFSPISSFVCSLRFSGRDTRFVGGQGASGLEHNRLPDVVEESAIRKWQDDEVYQLPQHLAPISLIPLFLTKVSSFFWVWIIFKMLSNFFISIAFLRIVWHRLW